MRTVSSALTRARRYWYCSPTRAQARQLARALIAAANAADGLT
jgi:hypothetical protein